MREYDAELAEWEPGRLMALGIAACLLGGTSLERFKLEDQWAARHRVQTDLARLLRFLARRALDRRPAVPHIAIAAADMAAALEYEVLDRGAGAWLEAIRRRYPADEARRRRVGDPVRCAQGGCRARLGLGRGRLVGWWRVRPVSWTPARR